ncbi:MAG TPA: polysaccharide deacetylase family protein [Chitinophagales bacterium]|nr:polysaccharide deacetylase family protein [Chitinophagales bacterium]
MNKLLVYTDQSSNRLKYIFDLILTDLLGLKYELTHDKTVFSSSTLPRFSYCAKPVGDELFLQAEALLFEIANRPQPINFCEYNKIRGFYPVSGPSCIPFDIFASAFFLVTRYEEYFPGHRDKYDRFRPSTSMNAKGGYLEKPMVNYYALELKRILIEKFPDLVITKKPFEYIPTFDVDMAYSYLNKGFVKNAGGFFRSLVLSDFKEMRERFDVLLGRKPDPFDTFDYLLRVCRENNLRSIFFFLVGDESRLDKNIPFDNEAFRSLIKSIAKQTNVGVHLSYKSHVSTGRSRMEIERLEKIVNQPVVRNRFHYLRFKFPDTFKRLVNIGIKEDYSMGYASRNGFRAGICTPFYYFDIRQNTVSDLKIFPFAFMDSTFAHYQKTDPESALNEIRTLMRYVYETGGPVYGLWHNSSFTGTKEWKGYEHVFETVATEAAALMQQQS